MWSLIDPTINRTSLVDGQVAKRGLILDTFRDCTSRQVDMMRRTQDKDTFASRDEQDQSMQKERVKKKRSGEKLFDE